MQSIPGQHTPSKLPLKIFLSCSFQNNILTWENVWCVEIIKNQLCQPPLRGWPTCGVSTLATAEATLGLTVKHLSTRGLSSHRLRLHRPHGELKNTDSGSRFWSPVFSGQAKKIPKKATDCSSDFPLVWLPAPDDYLENVNQNLVIVLGTGNRKPILHAREINVINSQCGQLAWSSLSLPVYSFRIAANYFPSRTLKLAKSLKYPKNQNKIIFVSFTKGKGGLNCYTIVSS